MRTTLLTTIRSQLSNRDALGTVILRGVLAASELVCALVIARMFKATGYGIYALVLAWVGLLAIPAAAGFDRLVIREIAVQRARDEWALARGLLNRSRTVVLACSIALAGAVAALAPVVATEVPRETITAFQIGLFAVPFIAYGRLRQAVLQGLGRVAAAQIPEALVQPLVLLTLAGTLYFGSEAARTGTLAVILYTVSVAAACIAGIVILRKCLPDAIRRATPAYRTREWVRGAMPFVALLGFNVVMTNADTVLVGFLAGATDAGVYRLASQVAMLISFPLTCVNMAVAPRLAARYARGDSVGLQSDVRDAARTVLLLTLPIVVALGLGGPFLLRFFGPGFEQAYPPLLVLCAGQLVNVAMGASGYLLIMTRHEGRVAAVFGAFAALDVLGALVLIPVWGILGAAASTALSLALMSATMAILARRRLGIQATLFALNAPARETGNA